MPTEVSVHHDPIRSAATRLTGHERRAFIAEVTRALRDASARRPGRIFRRSRHTAELGPREDESGVRCLEHFRERGRVRGGDANPALARAIRDWADPHARADPRTQSSLRYTRPTARSSPQALIDETGLAAEGLPGERSPRRTLNRTGYRSRRIQKTRPLKKVPRTDAIFADIAEQHQKAVREQETTSGVGIDVKAKVDPGEFGREGRTRGDTGGETPAALDHDYRPEETGCRSGS